MNFNIKKSNLYNTWYASHVNAHVCKYEIDEDRMRLGDLVELESGRIVEIDKPDILDYMCYGSLDRRTDTNAILDDSVNTRSKLYRNHMWCYGREWDIREDRGEYFKELTLKDLNDLIFKFNHPETYEYYTTIETNYGGGKVKKIDKISILWVREIGEEPYVKDATEEYLTQTDIERVRNSLERLKEKCEKKLNDYIKRHGGKPNIWYYAKECDFIPVLKYIRDKEELKKKEA